MKNVKKLLSLLLALSMASSMVCTTALAEEATESCIACSGTGHVDCTAAGCENGKITVTSKTDCEVCGGTGKVTSGATEETEATEEDAEPTETDCTAAGCEGGKITVTSKTDCEVCGGTGKVACTDCGGTGKVAKPDPVVYTVTFDADNGTESTTAQVTAGTTATRPDDPSKDGYTFTGWFQVMSEGAVSETAWDFGSPVTDNLTLKAKWTEVTSDDPRDDIELGNIKVKVECVNTDLVEHNTKYEGPSDLFEGTYTVTETNGAYTLNVQTQVYVGGPRAGYWHFNTGGAMHIALDETVTVPLVKNSQTGKWGVNNADNTVHIQVVCAPQVENELGLSFVCDSNGPKHTFGYNAYKTQHLFKDYWELDNLKREGGSITCTLAVNQEYLLSAAYNGLTTAPSTKDTWAFLNEYGEHTLNPDGSTATVTYHWDREQTKWVKDGDISAVTIHVKCNYVATSEESDLYVSNTGSDTAAGTKDAPFATLAHAVQAAKDDATIHVLSDLAMESFVNVSGKAVTITSDGGSFTVTKASTFQTTSDSNRSWYNPAMIEVHSGSATLQNITFEDSIKPNQNGKTPNIFKQAGSQPANSEGNLEVVQDGIISAYDSESTITLGNGAVLQNFAGLSAVKVENGILVMEDGSSISGGGSNATKDNGGDGARGAVWLQNGTFQMNGGTISNVTGRAVMAEYEKSVANIGGTIADITADAFKTWQGTNGVAIHLRGNASATVSGTVENVTDGGIIVFTEGCDFTLEEDGEIKNCKAGSGYGALIDANHDVNPNAKTVLDGKITNCSDQSANAFIYYCNAINGLTIGETAVISGNTCKNLIYDNSVPNDGHDKAMVICGTIEKNVLSGCVLYGGNNGRPVELYGKINANTLNGVGSVVGFGCNRRVTMHTGSEIKNNTVANGTVLAVNGEGNCFTMNGGEISGNTASQSVFSFTSGSWQQCSTFEITGGTVSGNTAPHVLMISGGGKIPGIHSYLLVPEFETTVYFDKQVHRDNTEKVDVEDYCGKWVTVDAGTKLGNANRNQGKYAYTDRAPGSDPRSVANLNTAAKTYGLKDAFATFWAQNASGTTVSVKMDTPAGTDLVQFDLTKSIYVLAQAVDEKGKPADGAEVSLIPATVKDGVVSFKLPGNENGYAVALAQLDPDAQKGTLTLEVDKEEVYQSSLPVDLVYTATFTPKDGTVLTGATYTLKLNGETVSGFDGNQATHTVKLDNSNFKAGESYTAMAVLTITVDGQTYHVLCDKTVSTKMIGLRQYTVTFTDGVGGTVFADQSHTVKEGAATPAFVGTPSRSGYTFSGWSPTVAATVTGNQTYTAQWSEISVPTPPTPPTTYYTITVKYVDEDGAAIAPDATVTTTGAYNVTDRQIEIDGYTFKEADRPLTGTVYANTTITLTYTKNAAPTPGEYTITVKYVDEEGNTIAPDVTVVTTDGGQYDVTARQIDIDGYTFREADGALAGTVAEDTTITLIYTADEEPVPEEYMVTVRYVDEEGNVIHSSVREATTDGGQYDVTDKQAEIDGYTFKEADKALTGTVTEDTTITLTYAKDEEESTHTVTWVNWNNAQLYRITGVAEGVVIPSSDYSGATPYRPSSGMYDYRFTGWSSAEVDSDGNVTYRAQYTPTLISTDPTPGDGGGGGGGGGTPSTPPAGDTPGGTVTVPDTTPPLGDSPDGGDTITIDDGDVPLASATGLNNVDHFAYIIGYEDDTVRPLNNITRAEVATIFFRLMTDVYRTANWATANDFSDVSSGSWYNNAVSTCAEAGLVTGYPDGTFKPNQSITRAEFAAIAARFLSDEVTGDEVGDFSDTAGHWAAKEIRRAAEAGWVTGSNNAFRPNDKINRAEVMTIVNRMLDRIPDADHMLENMKKWSDNPKDAWYYEAVQEATNEHAYERDEAGAETWTELLTVRDWKALEAEWAEANAK